MDKKDEIILQQLDVIRSMTENGLKRMNTDFWGNPQPKKETPKKEEAKKAEVEADAEKPAEEELPPPEKLEDLLAELDTYIGLDVIKEEVRSLINMVKVYKLRREHDLPTADLSLHMVFSGNPGTGKTMIARLMARIYHSLDLLSKGQLVEVDRSGLVAGYVGQTALKTKKVIEKAMGGVLFIDEAYSLCDSTDDRRDFGYRIIESLLTVLAQDNCDMLVILAGYPDDMERLINSNHGLASRFPNRFLFPDYNVDELMQIAKSIAATSSRVQIFLNCK